MEAGSLLEPVLFPLPLILSVRRSRGGQGSGVVLPSLGCRAASSHCWVLERWPWAWIVGGRERRRESVRDLPSPSSTFPTPCDPGAVMSLGSHEFCTDSGPGLVLPISAITLSGGRQKSLVPPPPPHPLTALSEKPRMRTRAGAK